MTQIWLTSCKRAERKILQSARENGAGWLAFYNNLSLYGSMTDARKPIEKTTKAIAIQGAQETDSNAPPKIVAKGSGDLAEKILDIAFAEGVKVRQDQDLTELLDAFNVDSPIPLEALHAVSLILERVYAENQKLAGGNKEDEVTTAADHNSGFSPTLDGHTGEPVPVDSNIAGGTSEESN